MMYEISLQLAHSGFDYFAGGSALDPSGNKSSMTDKPGSAFDVARQNGYRVTTTRSDFEALSATSGKVWAITEYPADEASMEYDLDRHAGSTTLAEFTKKGITLLDNPKGFFMMGGRREDRLGMPCKRRNERDTGKCSHLTMRCRRRLNSRGNIQAKRSSW